MYYMNWPSHPPYIRNKWYHVALSGSSGDWYMDYYSRINYHVICEFAKGMSECRNPFEKFVRYFNVTIAMVNYLLIFV